MMNLKTKQPLPMFFVDLDARANIKEIYNVEFLLNMKVKIEPKEQKKKIGIIQCTRSKHMDTVNLNHSFVLSVEECIKQICVINQIIHLQMYPCEVEHPANYKECTTHKELLKIRSNKKITNHE